MTGDRSEPLALSGHSQEDYLRQHRELQILLDISSAIYSSPHLEDVLQRSLLAILHTFNLEMGAIYLVQDVVEGNWILDLAAHHGFTPALVKSIQTLSIPMDLMEDFDSSKPVRWYPISKIFFSELRENMREKHIMEVICIPLMNKQKRVLGLFYVTNDRTVQLRPERTEFLSTIGSQLGSAIENAQLFESVERARSELEISFDAIQHSIFLVDTRLRIHRVNRTSLTVYGGGRNPVGRRYSMVLYGQETPPEDCPILTCFREGEQVQREGPHPRWGGYYLFYAFPVFNSTGAIERVVYYEKDETEARRLDQRMQQTDRLKSLGTLAAGIAHEIRNPLATINFNTQMLQRELTLDRAEQQMFDDMAREIKKIDRIVQQVLHFAKPREPQFLLHRINDVVSYCIDLARVYLSKGNLKVVVDTAEDLPLLVIDFNQISQVIMNLLINAIEAMPDGGRLLLKTDLKYDPPAVLIEVTDSGSGILDEDRERIFDPFFTRKPDGTGLGLSISRQILEKHGAYIEAECVPGTGTTFRIVFPLSSINDTLLHTTNPPMAQ